MARASAERKLISIANQQQEGAVPAGELLLAAELDRAGDALSVNQGAIGGFQVVDPHGAIAPDLKLGMPARGLRIPCDDVAFLPPDDGQGLFEPMDRGGLG